MMYLHKSPNLMYDLSLGYNWKIKKQTLMYRIISSIERIEASRLEETSLKIQMDTAFHSSMR